MVWGKTLREKEVLVRENVELCISPNQDFFFTEVVPIFFISPVWSLFFFRNGLVICESPIGCWSLFLPFYEGDVIQFVIGLNIL